MCPMCVYIVVHLYVMCVNIRVSDICTPVFVFDVFQIHTIFVFDVPTPTCLMFVPIFDVCKRRINHFKEPEGKGYQEKVLTGPST